MGDPRKRSPGTEKNNARLSLQNPTHGRNMAGARALWRATGMKDGDFGKPIIAVVNSFTQFVPGHVHLKDLGQLVARKSRPPAGWPGVQHDRGRRWHRHGSRRHAVQPALPGHHFRLGGIHGKRPLRRRHGLHLQLRQDHPGMLNAAMRLNIPVVFVSGGPMEAGKTKLSEHKLDLVDAMVIAVDDSASDEKVAEYERSACPTCGSCSGMFTANSMNCLTEALGLSLPGNGSTLATHADREQLFCGPDAWWWSCASATIARGRVGAAAQCRQFQGLRERHVPGYRHGRLHQYHPAPAGGRPGSRARFHPRRYRPPVAQGAKLCKVAPNTPLYHMEDVHRAGGIMGILGELDRAGLLHTDCPTVHSASMKRRWPMGHRANRRCRCA